MAKKPEWYLVLQEGGTSLEWYCNVYPNLKQANARKKDLDKNTSFRSVGPIKLGVFVGDQCRNDHFAASLMVLIERCCEEVIAMRIGVKLDRLRSSAAKS